MNVTQKMSAAAEAAAQRYGLLVEGWRALFKQALDARDFGQPRQISQMRKQVYDMAARYLNAEEDMAHATFSDIASEAHQTTLRDLGSVDARELTDAASDHQNALVSYLRQELAIQIERDIAFLERSLRKTAIQVTMSARAQGISVLSALISYRIGNAQELQFFFHDRQNRKFPSRKFVRGLWRHNLLGLYNDIVLMTLADHGVTRAQVRHVNAGAETNGMLITILTNTALPSYGEIRDEVFHPNSDAILGVSDVSA